MVEIEWSAAPPAGAVKELVAAAAAVDGAAAIGENTLLHLGSGDDVVAVDADGGLVGFAHLDPAGADGSRGAELVVHPGRRRCGIGTQIVAELLARTTPATLRVWAHGDAPGAVALAERLGFDATRALWRMRRPLATPRLPQPAWPPGVMLRPFVVGTDEQEFLRVNNAAFDWHPEQGGWDVEQVRLREAEPWFDPTGFLLAVDTDDRLLGYHWTKVHHDETPPIGEVYVLGVDPAARGLHLGTALTLAGLHHLRDQGLADVMLYVEGDNTAAIRVYQQLGFTRFATDVSYER